MLGFSAVWRIGGEIHRCDLVGIVGPWPRLGLSRELELGWDLFEGATGKGYATEAARAARRYAYDVLGWTTPYQPDCERKPRLRTRGRSVLAPPMTMISPTNALAPYGPSAIRDQTHE